jgi:tRNA-Thr(GGU) m(6)t(6)A37 methyltransferase TsaA
MDHLTFTPIGTIHSPYTEPAGMPIQPAGAAGVKGTVVIDEQFRAGLRDLDGFSRVILIYAFHRCTGYSLDVVPFLDTRSHGIFATRAPRRPNAIGISIVRLVRVTGCELEVEDIDILDGTPLLDIKPYVPSFDCFPEGKAGWFGDCRDRVADARADHRFSGKST